MTQVEMWAEDGSTIQVGYNTKKKKKEKPACYDCGLKYKSKGWADVVVPDSIWVEISPSGDEGGLLCFTCMNRRLTQLGLWNVPFQVTSGPFAFAPR